MKSFLLFLVFFLTGLAILLSYQYWNPLKLPVVGTKSALTTNFSLEKAPSSSLIGKIASMSGSVNWLSRTSSKPIQLKSPRAVQQGEEISTGSNGKTMINIQNDALLFLQPNTHISIIQLLPQNFVFVQDKGIVQYANSIQVPISIKSFDLVTIIIKGFVTISVDQKNQIISVKVDKGFVREGYEDLQNTSNVATVNEGQTFVFDETNKIGTIQ